MYNISIKFYATQQHWANPTAPASWLSPVKVALSHYPAISGRSKLWALFLKFVEWGTFAICLENSQTENLALQDRWWRISHISASQDLWSELCHIRGNLSPCFVKKKKTNRKCKVRDELPPNRSPAPVNISACLLPSLKDISKPKSTLWDSSHHPGFRFISEFDSKGLSCHGPCFPSHRASILTWHFSWSILYRLWKTKYLLFTSAKF